MAGRTILIIGGADSGKTRFALDLARRTRGERYYLATADPIDLEMREKIRHHQQTRSSAWHTIKARRNLPEAIRAHDLPGRVLLIDGLGLWIARFMTRADGYQAPVERLMNALRRSRGTVICVTEEVGLGIVPGNRSTRAFRRILGQLNQELAARAHQVFFIVAGLQLRLK